MAKKIFKILATSLALSTITFLGTELATARGGGGGQFSRGGGGAHFSGGGARFSGAQFRGVSGGAARLGGAHFRSFNGTRVSGPRGLAQLNRTHARGLNAAHLGSTRFARMNGAQSVASAPHMALTLRGTIGAITPGEPAGMAVGVAGMAAGVSGADRFSGRSSTGTFLLSHSGLGATTTHSGRTEMFSSGTPCSGQDRYTRMAPAPLMVMPMAVPLGRERAVAQ